MKNNIEELNEIEDNFNRRAYLNSLSSEYGVDINIVNALADVLGPSEDMDGLISMLQDMDYFM